MQKIRAVINGPGRLNMGVFLSVILSFFLSFVSVDEKMWRKLSDVENEKEDVSFRLVWLGWRSARENVDLVLTKKRSVGSWHGNQWRYYYVATNRGCRKHTLAGNTTKCYRDITHNVAESTAWRRWRGHLTGASVVGQFTVQSGHQRGRVTHNGLWQGPGLFPDHERYIIYYSQKGKAHSRFSVLHDNYFSLLTANARSTVKRVMSSPQACPYMPDSVLHILQFSKKCHKRLWNVSNQH